MMGDSDSDAGMGTGMGTGMGGTESTEALLKKLK